MSILGINIFGQGIQIFLNIFSLILGCQETGLLHKKHCFLLFGAYCSYISTFCVAIVCLLSSNKATYIHSTKCFLGQPFNPHSDPTILFSGLTSEDTGRLATLEARMRQLTEAIQSNDDFETKIRRQKRVIMNLKRRLETIETQLGRDHCQELNPCR